MPALQPVTRRAVQALPEGNALPTQFLIFAPGDNPSTQGPAVWDATAAAAVMAKAKERGAVEYPIDLEHRSLDKAATTLTKDATDAQGWFKLAVRNGALWAIDVRWTAEGAERLRAKKQRYTSPAFYWLDGPNGRVGELVNVALVSMPATHDQAALVAASRGGVAKVPVNKATQEAAKKLLAEIAPELLEPSPKLDARNSTVIAARVPNATARRIEHTAAGAGVTPGALVRGIVTRALSPAERDYCQRHKITPAEFVARTRAAVRTQPKKAR
jgi:phage I-like protein